MGRTACVDLPDLPLQLLLREHPDWRKTPVAVVADDRPQAEVQWASTPPRKRSWKVTFSSTSRKRGSSGVECSIAWTSVGSAPVR